MHPKLNLDPVIYFEGKPYPVSAYLQAMEAADKDARLKEEIQELELKYIRMHLKELTA